MTDSISIWVKQEGDYHRYYRVWSSEQARIHQQGKKKGGVIYSAATLPLYDAAPTFATVTNDGNMYPMLSPSFPFNSIFHSLLNLHTNCARWTWQLWEPQPKAGADFPQLRIVGNLATLPESVCSLSVSPFHTQGTRVAITTFAGSVQV